MKRLFLTTIFLMAVFLISVNTHAQTAMNRYAAIIQGPAAQAIQRAGGHVIHEFQIIPVISFMAPETAIDGLRKNPTIIDIASDVLVTANPKPSNPGKPGDTTQPPEKLEWGVDVIDADEVWDQDHNLVIDEEAFTGAGINVAIIDTGIDMDHPDLAANIGGGRNFVPDRRGRVNPDKWDDDHGHGTHVAGIVGAVDNEIGVIGVAPRVTLYGLKVLDSKGQGYLTDIMTALEWCTTRPAEAGFQIHVANMSLGFYDYDGSFENDIFWNPLFQMVCDVTVYEDGVILVAAAGNEGENAEHHYPSAYESVISVGAIDSDNGVPLWSNWGSSSDNLELAAPGVSVRSTWKGGGYEVASGTSMATPHVTGVVALVLETGLYYLDVRGRLQVTADNPGGSGWDMLYGYGLVDAEEAVFGPSASPAPPRHTISPTGKLTMTWGGLKSK